MTNEKENYNSDTDIRDYTVEVEELFIRFFLSCPDLFVRCLSVVRPKHYTSLQHRKAVEFILSHTDEHHVLPTLDQIQALSGKRFEPITELTERHEDWFLNEYEVFARHKELEIEILNAPDLLKKGRYGEVETKIKKAVQMGLVKDLGTNYFHDPRGRLEALRKKDHTIPTGWRDLDVKLFGGVIRGSLNVVAGQSGQGKSLFLQNWSLNFVEQGLNVVYITYELSEKLCATRIDAMVTGYSTKDVFKNLDDVELRIGTYNKKNKGLLQIKQLPCGSTTNDIRAYIKEFEIQTNKRVDVIAVDYLDLMSPYTVKVSAENMFIKDKYVTEELRNLAIELDCVVLSASQLNRSSYESADFDPSNIAGGISKINTSDNVFAIYSSTSMREQGRYQLQLMKTRSSSGVGSKIDLKFDIHSLRIVDLPPGEESASSVNTRSVIDNLKAKGSIKQNPKPADDSSRNVINEGVKLRELLKRGTT